MTTVAFFNNKGGVGKTSLVYHLAWMLRERGRRVIAADLDPQANLTGMFLDETGLERLWRNGNQGTIDEGVAPLFEGTGDIAASPRIEEIGERIGLLMGDLALFPAGGRALHAMAEVSRRGQAGISRHDRIRAADRTGRKAIRGGSGPAGRRPESRRDQPCRPGRRRLRGHSVGSRPVLLAGIEKRRTDPQGLASRLEGARRQETARAGHRTALGRHAAAGLRHHAAFHPALQARAGLWPMDRQDPLGVRGGSEEGWPAVRAGGAGPELSGSPEGLSFAHADGAGGEPAPCSC